MNLGLWDCLVFKYVFFPEKDLKVSQPLEKTHSLPTFLPSGNKKYLPCRQFQGLITAPYPMKAKEKLLVFRNVQYLVLDSLNDS